jgi:hypothetical protein
LDYLSSPEKYKAFFIFQYKNQDKWLEPTLERFFSERTWRLFNAGKEGGTGTKFCNVCRYALSSDFGIASLTPLNFNVYQEIGLMQGLQKPLLYLLNPDRRKEIKNGKLPFDIDDQIYISHTNEHSLEKGLNNKIGLLIDKVILLSGFESAQKDLVKSEVDLLTKNAKELLKKIVLKGPFRLGRGEFHNLVQSFKIELKYIDELYDKRFLVNEYDSWGKAKGVYFCLHEPYRKHLEELLWQ